MAAVGSAAVPFYCYMPDREPVFLVNPYSEPVFVKIQGRASFLNAPPLREFFQQMVEQGKRGFVVDFEACTGMDSTFMGILAGAGISLMKTRPPGQMVLTRLGPRNLDLVRNLGLDRLMTVDSGETSASPERATEALKGEGMPATESAKARLLLEAHENLVKVDAANEAKFQDVIAFLRNQAES